MTDQPLEKATKVCPSCGTKASEDAARCLVCGHQFTPGSGRGPVGRSARASSPAGVPELRLSLPLAVGLLVLFIFVGGGLTYFGLAQSDRIAQPTTVPSATASPTITATFTPETPTLTSTPQPTLTPITYTVQQNDTCGTIAFTFTISVQSIILENSLPAECNLFVGQVLSLPQPTFTPTPQATATLSELEATIAACQTELYVVQEDETLSLIAQSYGVPGEAILEWNGLTSDIVFVGQQLVIPFCERVFVGGSTVTPTLAPDYPQPELLLPADGAPFNAQNNTVTLQWSSVGTLRTGESYQVTVIDVTGGQNTRVVEEVPDTSYIVPSNLRPTDGQVHVFRWFVVPVLQIGVDDSGLPVYVNLGPVSNSRVFSWSGSAGGAATPAP